MTQQAVVDRKLASGNDASAQSKATAMPKVTPLEFFKMYLQESSGGKYRGVLPLHMKKYFTKYTDRSIDQFDEELQKAIDAGEIQEITKTTEKDKTTTLVRLPAGRVNKKMIDKLDKHFAKLLEKNRT